MPDSCLLNEARSVPSISIANAIKRHVVGMAKLRVVDDASCIITYGYQPCLLHGKGDMMQSCQGTQAFVARSPILGLHAQLEMTGIKPCSFACNTARIGHFTTTGPWHASFNLP